MQQDQLTEKVVHSISTSELERRWFKVREIMKREKVDFLIFQSFADYFAGYVKWFTDIPAVHEYAVTVIFPKDDEMTMISHGSSDSSKAGPPPWMARGVKKRLSSPYMPSLNFTTHFEAEKVVNELSQYQSLRIGLLNEGAMSAGLVQGIRKNLKNVVFVDLTDEIDRIKAIKSPEEIERIRYSAYLHDRAMEACINATKPGVREFEIAAAGRYVCRMLGSEQQFILIGSAPAGSVVSYNHIHAMNRSIQYGDQVGILVEANEPTGYYTHLHRTICVGKIPTELKENFEIVLEAQKLSLDLLKPGAVPLDLFNSNNEFMRQHGLPEETRIYAHGQGVDLLERPSLQPGETMIIEAGMNIAVHPEIITKGAKAQVCDNYIVTDSGVSECLHKTPKILIEV